MVGCCLRLDALGHFLAMRAGVGLTAAALAGLARIHLMNALDAVLNADTLGMLVVARCTDAGYTRAKSWGTEEHCCLPPCRGWCNTDCLPFHD